MHNGSRKAIELDQSLGLSIIVVRDNVLFKQEPNGIETCLGKCTFKTIKVRKLNLKKV